MFFKLEIRRNTTTSYADYYTTVLKNIIKFVHLIFYRKIIFYILFL